jgi:hypothetical protein
MKKLLYTLLAVSIIFSACENKPEETSNTGNNNNSALAIGDNHQGGIIFYLDGNGGGLIAAPSDQYYLVTGLKRHIEVVEWGCGTEISGADATAIGTGAQNTIDIEAGCTTINTAADICANLTLGGYSDWFLPSKDELNEMYLNIGQGNALGLGNIGGFANSGYYWSSTESDYHSGWTQKFGKPFKPPSAHYPRFSRVRAVRAFDPEPGVNFLDIPNVESTTTIVYLDRRRVSTIKIDNLEVTEDLGGMNWDKAKKAIESLGNGWRLPTKDELNVLYQNREKLGSVPDDFYWGSTEHHLYTNYVWGKNFYKNENREIYLYTESEYYSYPVRAVRDL